MPLAPVPAFGADEGAEDISGQRNQQVAGSSSDDGLPAWVLTLIIVGTSVAAMCCGVALVWVKRHRKQSTGEPDVVFNDLAVEALPAKVHGESVAARFENVSLSTMHQRQPESNLKAIATLEKADGVEAGNGVDNTVVTSAATPNSPIRYETLYVDAGQRALNSRPDGTPASDAVDVRDVELHENREKAEGSESAVLAIAPDASRVEPEAAHEDGTGAAASPSGPTAEAPTGTASSSVTVGNEPEAPSKDMGTQGVHV